MHQLDHENQSNSHARADSSPKNIIICCDGTSNQFENDETNVWKLTRILDNDSEQLQQISYYDPGVGTMPSEWYRTGLAKNISTALGLAFGTGFSRNLEEAYRFLMQEYQAGDRIFMFGFSRGAYTVRALAGMIHMFGLLERNQENLIPYLTRAYKGAMFDVADRIVGTPATRQITIHFLGAWDTVSSIGFAFNRKTFPFTANNKSVLTIRHAVAIDERRAYFRQNGWGRQIKEGLQQNHLKRLEEEERIHESKNASYYCDLDCLPNMKDRVKEVWFPGVHCDVGGGYPQKDNRLAEIPFHWLVEEARTNGRGGIVINQEKYLREFDQIENEKVVLNAKARLHESLIGPWWLLEFLPMNYTLKKRQFFFPVGRRRQIRDDITIHQCVLDRMEHGEYLPPNLSGYQGVERWHDNSVQKLEDADVPGNLARTAAFFGAIFYLTVGIYLIVIAGYLSLHLVWAFWAQFLTGTGWPPNWLELSKIVFWPISFFQYCVGRGSVFTVPLAVLFAGGWIMNQLSGFGRFRSRVHGEMLHSRLREYDDKLACKQMKYLKSDGQQAYFKMLRIDLVFPIFYGAALFWGLYHSQLAQLVSSLQFLLFLPVVTILADWIENSILLKQLPKCDSAASNPSENGGPLDPAMIRIASIATHLKIITFAIALVALLLASLSVN